MISETETTDGKCSDADTEIPGKIENAPASGDETSVMTVDPVVPTSDAPNISTNSTVEENPATGNGSSVSTKYPKLNASSSFLFLLCFVSKTTFG